MAKRKSKPKAQQQADPWRDGFDELRLPFHNAFYDSLDAWMEAEGDDTDALQSGAIAIDPVGSITSAKATLSEIESWLRDQADEFLEAAEVTGKEKVLRKRLAPGWLAQAMQSHLSAIQTTLKQLKDGAQECVEFAQEYNGIGGMLRGAFKGWMNPVDGIASIFGEGSINKESTRIAKTLNRCATQLDEVVATADAALDELVVTKWNIEIITLAEDDDEKEDA